MVALDGVTPDVAPGHWPEHFTRASLMRRKLPAYPSMVAGRLRRTLGRGSRVATGPGETDPRASTPA